MGLALKKDLQERNRKGKKWPQYFNAFLSKMKIENIYIPEMTQFSEPILTKPLLFFNHPVFSCCCVLP